MSFTGITVTDQGIYFAGSPVFHGINFAH